MATISGRLIFDSARTANASPALPGIANVQIVLQDITSGAMLAVLTGANGNYSFINVPDGNYEIVECYGMTPANPTPGDFTAATTGSILTGGVVPPLSYAPAASVPTGATDLDCVTPNTLLIAVSGFDLTGQNILNGPVRYKPITAIIDSHAVILPENVLDEADEGTFGSWPPGTPATTVIGANPYPGVGTGFTFVQSSWPRDGEFSILNIDNYGFSTWWYFADHTTGNETGRMMVVNGDNPGAVIYQETVTVKPDTYYLFTTWILNAMKVAGYANPALGVKVLDANGQILIDETLGQLIPVNTHTPEWVEIGSVIYSGSNSTLTVRFESHGPAADGNDYAIDDIGLYELTMVPNLIPLKTCSVPNANVGYVVIYTVTLSNVYDRDITNVVFQDSVPDGLLFVPGSVTVNGVSQPTANPNAGFALPDIPGGDAVTVTFSVAVENVPLVNPTLNTAKITFDYTIVEGGVTSSHEAESNEVPLYIKNPKPTPKKPCSCYTKATKCRKTIKGHKIWIDDDNKGDTRPPTVEIILLRDDEVYKSIIIDSADDEAFVFCCVPIGKRRGHKYNYRIDEANVPYGYTKTIEGYNVINTLNP